jgi:hypothetical protein
MVETPTSTRPVYDIPPPRDRRRVVVVVVAAVLALAVLAGALVVALRTGLIGDGQPDELTWAPPELDDPETVQVTEDDHGLKLDPEKDYIVEMPDEPLDVPGGVVIVGGHDVVLIGGEIRISEPGDRYQEIRGLYLKNQTGTVHIEGLHISGEALGEGINLDEREGATVQLQNILVDTVHGEREGHHADIIQTWAGPSVLRVDRLTGYTTYQGFFLLAKQFIDDDPEGFDLRHVNIVGGPDAAYMLWRDGDDWPIDVQDVWIAPDKSDDRADDKDASKLTWAKGDGDDTWDDVQVGLPPDGDFVTADQAGVGYVSPGYLDDDK